MSKSVREVSDSSFEQIVLLSDRPVLVHFWAKWSKECQLTRQTVAVVAEANLDLVSVVNLNVDENPVAARQYSIRMVPTLILFNAGVEAERIEGVTSKASLGRVLDQYKSPTIGIGNKKSPYEILNISEGASREEIIVAYKKMAQQYHPDKVANLAPEFKQLADVRMKEINLAYESLIR